jgi:hypothetical protein
MQKSKWLLWAFIGVALFGLTSCEFVLSSAKVETAVLAVDEEGTQPELNPQGQWVFEPDDTFYLIVELTNAPNDTEVRAEWRYIEGAVLQELESTEVQNGTGTVVFSLQPREDRLWELGEYEVRLFVNDDQKKSIKFVVSRGVFEFGA